MKTRRILTASVFSLTLVAGSGGLAAASQSESVLDPYPQLSHIVTQDGWIYYPSHEVPEGWSVSYVTVQGTPQADSGCSLGYGLDAIDSSQGFSAEEVALDPVTCEAVYRLASAGDLTAIPDMSVAAETSFNTSSSSGSKTLTAWYDYGYEGLWVDPIFLTISANATNIGWNLAGVRYYNSPTYRFRGYLPSWKGLIWDETFLYSHGGYQYTTSSQAIYWTRAVFWNDDFYDWVQATTGPTASWWCNGTNATAWFANESSVSGYRWTQAVDVKWTDTKTGYCVNLVHYFGHGDTVSQSPGFWGWL
ncbi:MAG: hypothetical protein LBR33_00995 [Propionibacteriaceae bacterium]|jgi:hypothetical protein|nr:hypothetical protein [Propionibacteriaceae bacterium]